jgi:hypothetical protein
MALAATNPPPRTVEEPSSLPVQGVLVCPPATPDRRPRRKSMARRSGQVGYEEVKGGWYHVRDVSG